MTDKSKTAADAPATLYGQFTSTATLGADGRPTDPRDAEIARLRAAALSAHRPQSLAPKRPLG